MMPGRQAQVSFALPKPCHLSIVACVCNRAVASHSSTVVMTPVAKAQHLRLLSGKWPQCDLSQELNKVTPPPPPTLPPLSPSASVYLRGSGRGWCVPAWARPLPGGRRRCPRRSRSWGPPLAWLRWGLWHTRWPSAGGRAALRGRKTTPISWWVCNTVGRKKKEKKEKKIHAFLILSLMVVCILAWIHHKPV